MTEERLIIGKLLKPRGLKGDLRVFPLTDFPERFLRLQTCYLENESREVLQVLHIERADVKPGSISLAFRDFSDRSKAEQLSGCWLSVDREDAVELPPDTYFVCDLIGCDVYDERRGLIGKICRVDSTGANDVVSVCAAGEKDLLYPSIKQVVRKVDLVNKRVDVLLPDGLYELYR